MRERGIRLKVLIGRRMVYFASGAKYEAWFEADISRRVQASSPSQGFTSDEVWAHLEASANRQELIQKLTRRNKVNRHRRS